MTGEEKELGRSAGAGRVAIVVAPVVVSSRDEFSLPVTLTLAPPFNILPRYFSLMSIVVSLSLTETIQCCAEDGEPVRADGDTFSFLATSVPT
jgi:hypothetical protein